MASFDLLTGGLTLWFAICLCRCEVSEDNYNTLLTKLKSHVRLSEEQGHIRHESSPRPRETHCKQENPSVELSSENEVTNSESMLETGFRDLRLIYEECQRKIRKRLRRTFDQTETDNDFAKIRDKVTSLYNCVKVLSFRQLDDFLSYDVIPISRYLEFVRDVRNGTTPRTGGHPYAVNILSKTWIDLAVERLEKLLHGHSLRLRLDDGHPSSEGRGRRRDHRMFAMMMMGFVIMASILVPMGFQFLTVLGGKSLLMAKMALIMSAINGLKKIATSNVGYGLYHAGPEAFHHDPHHHGFHEKIFHIKAQEQPESPFNLVI